MGDRARPARAAAAAARCSTPVERAQPGLFAQLITVPLFHEHRILCQVAGHRMNVVKALPSLLIDEDEIRRFAAALEEVVAAARARAPRDGALRRADGARHGARARARAARSPDEGARHRRRRVHRRATSSPRCSTPAPTCGRSIA